MSRSAQHALRATCWSRWARGRCFSVCPQLHCTAPEIAVQTRPVPSKQSPSLARRRTTKSVQWTKPAREDDEGGEAVPVELDDNGGLEPPEDQDGATSGPRRAGRPSKPRRQDPSFQLDDSFLTKNVFLREQLDTTIADRVQDLESPKLRTDRMLGSACAVPNSIVEEISSMLQSYLALSDPGSRDFLHNRNQHLSLHCPLTGINESLMTLVLMLARRHDADVVRLSPEDISELNARHVDISWTRLHYDINKPSGPANSEPEEAEDEDSSSVTIEGVKMNMIPTIIGKASSLPDLLRHLRSQGSGTDEGASQMMKAKNLPSQAESCHQRLLALLNEAPSARRVLESSSVRVQRLLIVIEDYSLLRQTPRGQRFIEALDNFVTMRRMNGSSTAIIGTQTASRSPNAAQSPTSNRSSALQILVPIRVVDKVSLASEQESFISQVNYRHICEMSKWLGSSVRERLVYDATHSLIPGLDNQIWPLEKVFRLVSVAQGSLKEEEQISKAAIEQAMHLIEESDRDKGHWANSDDFPGQKDHQMRLDGLRKMCNTHEKKFLGGVIDARDIKTAFSQVQVAPESIEALKTLTSLSLVRPDAFQYGVLANDRIPGVLLYGPPGTGKTLLAKAVAKESGATMLEVSGSEVYDMFVGESEKNVRAIFTLAKKLSPCVVFIDEADALLGARGGGPMRGNHREIINQFLREWDGVVDMNAFIMVATNRPYDLDEASLRRLPRKILVDLPLEKDREEILRIHLAGELLDPEISVAELAAQTPLYSGSDLKNVCVAAAMSCVRDEFAAASAYNETKRTEEPDYEYAKRRTLRSSHFSKALEEISASINEDMGSLSAIRKFDEKYGDRRGRRKRLSYGFEQDGGDREKRASDAARVRQPA